jgi:hypothetical protein
MHLKVFVKLKKTLKTLSSGQKNPKKNQKTQKKTKNPKNPKKPKNPLGWFFLKTRVFSTLTGIAKRYGQTISNLGHAALLRRYELPL